MKTKTKQNQKQRKTNTQLTKQKQKQKQNQNQKLNKNKNKNKQNSPLTDLSVHFIREFNPSVLHERKEIRVIKPFHFSKSLVEPTE